MTDHNSRPLLAIAFGALCISFAPIFVKMLGEGILGPTAIGFWRTFLGSIILFVLVILLKKPVKLPRRAFILSAVGGFLFFADLFVWHRSIIYSGAGIATILGNTQVFWMALIGVVLFEERLKPSYLAAVLAGFIGVVLLVGLGSIEEFTLIYIKGIVYGLMTGVFYASYMTSLKKAGHSAENISFVTLMAYASFFSAVCLGVSMLIESDPYLPPDLYSWLVLISLALVAQSIGWWVISTNLSKLKASQSGMVLLLQPTLATVWGWMFYNEQLQLLQIVGAIITLGAIYFGSVRGKE